MSELQRVIKVIDWLIFNKVVKNRKDLAIKLGYTESSLSQIINGKVSLSDKFIKNLSEIDKRINKDWIRTGEDQMLKNETAINNTEMNNEIITLLKKHNENLTNELADKKEYIQFLMRQLETKNDEIKKKEAV